MFDNLTEKQARAKILGLFSEYCGNFHTEFPYLKDDRILYAFKYL